MTNSDKQAFPCPHSPELNSMDGSDGLTKREYFAGLAMQGMLSSLRGYTNIGVENLALCAVEQADALLLELSKDSEK